MCLKCLLEDELKRLQQRNAKIANEKPNQMRKNALALVVLVREAAVLRHYDCPSAKNEAIGCALASPATAAGMDATVLDE